MIIACLRQQRHAATNAIAIIYAKYSIAMSITLEVISDDNMKPIPYLIDLRVH